jgi:uncharacterized protein (TIGR02147 family)
MTHLPNPVSDYIDYRLFLADYYKWHKENTRRFSHRSLAASLGFTSPNFLKLVIDGKRNIGKDSLQNVTRGLGLNKQESEYFSYLVCFAQVKSVIAKNYYFGLIAAMRSRKNIKLVGADQFEYFSEWYHPVVRELVKGMTEPLDYGAIAQSMGNKVTPAKLKKSVALLKRLGLIRMGDANAYEHPSPFLTTENELKSFAVRKYHKEVLGVAQKALDEVPPHDREISQLTVKISPKGFLNIKQRIQQFREEVMQLVAQDKEVKNVYHVNFQFYPIAKTDNYEN